MTIWERTVLNMQKGTQKLSAAAAVFSERVKAEIDIVRLRIRMDEARSRIDELHRTIGKTVADLAKSGMMPKATDRLLETEELVSALSELSEREKEIEELKSGIRNEQDAFKQAKKQAEDKAV